MSSSYLLVNAAKASVSIYVMFMNPGPGKIVKISSEELGLTEKLFQDTCEDFVQLILWQSNSKIKNTQRC